MDELQDVYAALEKAHAAGNTEHVKQLVAYIKGYQPQTQAPAPQSEEENPGPFEYAPYSIPKETRGPDGIPRIENTPATPENYRKAAESGVDITTGPPDDQYLSTLGDPATRIQHLKKVILDKYGKDGVQFRDGKESGSGVLEYKPKGSKRWIATIPVNDPINFREVITGGLGVAGSIGGAVGGAFFGNIPGAFIGGAGGGVAGASAGPVVSNQLGKMAGVIPEEVDPLTGSAEAAKDAAIGEVVTGGLYGTGKILKAWGTGLRVFKPHEAADLLAKQNSANDIIEEIEKTTGQPFRPTTAEIVNRPKFDAEGRRIASTPEEIVAGNAQITAAQNSTEVARDLAQRSAVNRNTLRNYLLEALERRNQPPSDKGAAGAWVTKGVTNDYDVALAAANDLISKLPPGTSQEEAARIIHEAVSVAQAKQKAELVDPKYAAYENAIGFNRDSFTSKIQIPWSQNALKLDQQLKAEDLAVAREFGEATKESGEYVGAKTEKADIFHEWSMPGSHPTTVDLAVLDRRIKAVGELQRLAASGSERVKLPEGRYREIKGALVNMRNEFLEKYYPEVHKLKTEANDEFVNWISKYDRAVTKSMLIKGADGKFRFTEGETLQKLLASDDLGALRNFADVVKGNPEAKSQVNHMLLALFKKDYTNADGVATYEQVSKFKKDYESVLEAFFGKEGIKEITTLDGLLKKVHEEDQIIRNIGIGAKYATDDTVEVLNPENLVNQVVSGSLKPARLQAILSQLKKYPHQDAALKQWRAATSDALITKLSGPDGFINASKLETFMNGDGLPSLVKLFSAGGEQYGAKVHRMMRTLQDAVRIADQVGMQATVEANRSLIRGGVKAGLGPLNRHTTIINFGKDLRAAASAKRIHRALTDPEELNRLQNILSKYVSRASTVFGTGSVVGLSYDDY